MKKPIKSLKKPAVKGRSEAENSKKPKLKPLNPKESKNWKNKLEEDVEDEADLLEEEELEEFGSPHAFDDNFEDEDDRY